MSLFDRATSGFPLSISTGLAFESIFPPRQAVYDPSRTPPQSIQFSDYDQMWINVDTLIRNITEAVPKEQLINVNVKEMITILFDEMDTINSLLANEGQGEMTPVYYTCDYAAALRSIHRAFELRKRETPHAIWYDDMRNRTIKQLKKDAPSDVVHFPGSIRTSGKLNALMLTHYPYDLTSRKLFNRLDLLESNTGKLKKPAEWGTKYYPVPGYDMRILPFYRFLLLALGDKPLIKPFPIKIRKQIMDSAVKRAWTPMTTTEKVLLDLRLELHPMDYSVIESARSIL